MGFHPRNLIEDNISDTNDKFVPSPLLAKWMEMLSDNSSPFTLILSDVIYYEIAVS